MISKSGVSNNEEETETEHVDQKATKVNKHEHKTVRKVEPKKGHKKGHRVWITEGVKNETHETEWIIYQIPDFKCQLFKLQNTNPKFRWIFSLNMPQVFFFFNKISKKRE